MKRLYYIISLLIVGAIATSCDKDWDPVAEYKPVVMTPNMTIAEFKTLYDGKPTVIDRDDIIFSGKVISSDQDGNIYRSLYIEDATSGIELRVGLGSMYGFYPVGMTIYVNPKYLCLGNYRGMISLGYESSDPKYENGYISPSPSGGISQELIKKTIFRGVKGPAVAPKEITDMAQLTSNKDVLGTLVTIKNATFTREKITTWALVADPNVSNSKGEYGEHKIAITGGSLIIRTSPYCSFASYTTPANNTIVDVTGILTLFVDKYQLVLNRATDVVKVTAP